MVERSGAKRAESFAVRLDVGRSERDRRIFQGEERHRVAMVCPTELACPFHLPGPRRDRNEHRTLVAENRFTKDFVLDQERADDVPFELPVHFLNQTFDRRLKLCGIALVVHRKLRGCHDHLAAG